MNIEVIYKPGDTKRYTFLCGINDIEVGDLVVVPNQKAFGYVVVKVVGLAGKANIQGVQYKWAIQKVRPHIVEGATHG